MSIFRFCLFLITLSISNTALSANARSEAEDCISIENDSSRLACFDHHFSRDDSSQLSSDPVIQLSPIAARQAQESITQNSRFSLTAHKPNYFLPGTHNGSADYSIYGDGDPFLSNTEAKFQLSVKAPVLQNLWHNSSLSIAFTQVSYWQLYADDEASAPFRETNYEPEIMWDVPINANVLGFNLVSAGLRFNHQSNGQTRPLSRSWNRVIANAVFEKGPFVFSAETWSRVEKSGSVDDNPDIEDYMGRAQIGLAYKGSRHTIGASIKNNLASKNRSGVEVNWSFPLNKTFRGFMQIYSGYGENMIDMKNYNNRIGFGVTLTDWL